MNENLITNPNNTYALLSISKAWQKSEERMGNKRNRQVVIKKRVNANS